MPWKECHVMDERLRFIARLLDGEKMAAVCEEFGISRKTGYKIFERYKDAGLVGLTDRSRRPHRHANQLPMAVEKLIVRLKKEYPHWGAPKLRERLKQRWPEVACPAISTVHAVLDRRGLVRRRGRTRRRLGIGLERIAPGHPEQNGRHERLHLTLKTEATHPAAPNLLQQQARFDTFVQRYNEERPHQALDMQTPASRYTASRRPYEGLEELEYPTHDWTAIITTCGRICYQRRKINVSQVFAGQKVGVKQVDEHIWLVTFMHYDLGYFDDETGRLEPIDNPFGPKLLPMSPE